MAAERRTFVVILRDPHAGVATEWIKRRAPAGEERVVGPPPAAGLDFFSCGGDLARRTDTWWGQEVGARRPVVLAIDEPGLAGWLRSPMDADFVVAVAGPREAALYEGLDNVVAVVTRDPRLLADEAFRRYGPAEQAAGPEQPAFAPAPPGQPSAQPPPPVVPQSVHASPPGRRPHTPSLRPVPGIRGAVHRQRAPGREILEGVLARLARGAPPEGAGDLGAALLGFRPPVCVAVASRKGGVGKTAVAAALAAIFAGSLAPRRATACLVDANINNPDAWGQLWPESPAATFRVLVEHLEAGRQPPPPASTRTPALAVYPEPRDGGDGYTPAQIGAAAGHLRTRHAALVIDLPNRLPGFRSAEATIAASWIAASDVVVLPATADPAALTGVLEYLATENVRMKPVVVPYIVPRIRAVRNATEIRTMLDEIRVRSSALVEVPDDDRATLAVLRGLAVTEISPPLRQAYLRVAESVAAAAWSGSASGRPWQR